MNKIKAVIATFVILSMTSPFSVLASDKKPLNPGDFGTVSGETEDDEFKETNKNTGDSGVRPGTGQKPNGTTTVKKKYTEGEVGTKSNPWVRNIRTEYSETGLKNAVSNLMKSTPTNSTKYKTVIDYAKNGMTVSYSSGLPNYVEDMFYDFYITTYRSIIKAKVVNKQTIQTTKKDVNYNWDMKGPVSWNKDSKSNSISIKFDEVGTYTLTYLPYEEKTNTVSQTITGYGTESWPDDANKKTVTLYSTTSKTGPTTTKSINADTSRKQVWTFVVTSDDIKLPPIIITPDPPPGVIPPGSSTVDDLGDVDVTIVE